MTNPHQPELPAPYFAAGAVKDQNGDVVNTSDLFTSDQMHAYAATHAASRPADGVVPPPIVREVLEWYASAPTIWVGWNKEGWAEEAAAKASGHYTFIGEDKRGHNEYVPNHVRAEEALAAWDEAIASAPTSAQAGDGIPAGWKLVPIEPNWDMRNEGREFLIDGLEKEPEKLAYFLWKTMVAAAPEVK